VWAVPNWTVHVATVNAGEAQAQALPSAPTATSACTSPASKRTVIVSWAAITHATTYGIYQSTTSATGTYTLVTSVSTTSWTSGVLAAGHYWYEVVANIGTNWAGAKSAATVERTTTSTTCS
jgi:fibronectin type 3 domain-containing protein